VSNEETAEMSVLDLEAGKILRRVKVGNEPEGVTVRPDGKVVYVTCEEDNQVVAVDTSSFEVVARIETGARPRAIAFTADGATAFVTAELQSLVNVLDARANKPAGVIALPPGSNPLPPRPMGVILSADGKRAFVSNGRGQSVAVIDVANRRLVRMIEGVGTRPWASASTRTESGSTPPMGRPRTSRSSTSPRARCAGGSRCRACPGGLRSESGTGLQREDPILGDGHARAIQVAGDDLGQLLSPSPPHRRWHLAVPAQAP
jgi:YVTN family beta-propeller protein